MTNVDDSLSQRVHQLLQLAPGKSSQEVKVHFESLIRLESEERRESALLILETMTSECGHIIGLIAGDLLLQFGKPEDIPRLENAIHRLPKIDGLIDWRKRIGSTLKKLQHKASGFCICQAPFVRHEAPDSEIFETLERTVSPDWGPVTQRLRCRQCLALFVVTTEEGAHTPISRWERLQ